MGGLTVEDRAELTDLRAENAQLRMEEISSNDLWPSG
jgi:hypothetical protein